MPEKRFTSRSSGSAWSAKAGLALLAVLLLCTGTAAMAQGRSGGMPRDIPMGPPMNMPSVGRPGETPAAADRGMTTAMEASDSRLSRGMINRAKEQTRLNPDQFETDRQGALIVRGEVVGLGLNDVAIDKLRKDGFSVLRTIQIDGIDGSVVVLIKDGTSSVEALRRLRRRVPSATFDHNHVYFESGTVVGKSNALPSTGNPIGDIQVGLIDTSIATDVPPVRDATVIQRSFVRDGSAPAPHGTAVASILMAGTLPRSGGRAGKLYVGGVYGRDGRGGTAELLAQALGWMAAQRVAVINVSLIGPPNALVERVIGNLAARGFLIVAPVGNDGASARPLYPAAYPGVVAVSAVDDNGRLLPEASRGSRIDFVAPGIAQVTGPDGRPMTVRGTSFAAPVVSKRLAALLKAPDSAAAAAALSRLAGEAVQLKGGGGKRAYGKGLIRP